MLDIALGIIITVVWAWVGRACGRYWWKYELGNYNLAPVVVFMCLGPLAYIVGWLIHGDR